MKCSSCRMIFNERELFAEDTSLFCPFCGMSNKVPLWFGLFAEHRVRRTCERPPNPIVSFLLSPHTIVPSWVESNFGLVWLIFWIAASVFIGIYTDYMMHPHN